MDRMLVVVFDNETKAYEGKKALMQLDAEGSISVYAYAVLAKHNDGTATIKQGDDPGPLGTLVGTSLGSLIGLLGGPVGMAVGAAAGLAVGGAADSTTRGLAPISSTTSAKCCCRTKWQWSRKLKRTGRRRWTPAWSQSAEWYSARSC